MCVKRRWVFLVYILNIHLKSVTPQYHYHHHNLPEQYYEEDGLVEYDDISDYTRRRSTKHRSDDSNVCVCSCNRCARPKRCCQDICNYSCPQQQQTPQINQDVPMPANDNERVVFVPYPYPLVVNPAVAFKNDTSETTTTTTTKTPPAPEPTTTTTTTTTTTKAPPVVTVAPTPKPIKLLRNDPISDVEEIMSGRRNIKQLNPSSKRRIKPAWIPKYGIVPIPDHLAAKLMTQLTEVRALKSKRL